jgi:hypothetical protein
MTFSFARVHVAGVALFDCGLTLVRSLLEARPVCWSILRLLQQQPTVQTLAFSVLRSLSKFANQARSVLLCRRGGGRPVPQPIVALRPSRYVVFYYECRVGGLFCFQRAVLAQFVDIFTGVCMVLLLRACPLPFLCVFLRTHGFWLQSAPDLQPRLARLSACVSRRVWKYVYGPAGASFWL